MSQLPQEVIDQYVTPFENTCHYSIEGKGYIIWRLGTGDNIELLHIRTYKKRQGIGRQLFYGMLELLEYCPPYYSIFGFTRSTNDEAQRFYGALGFNLQPINGIYLDGTATLFWQSYKQLVHNKNEWCDHEDTLRSTSLPTIIKRR